MLLSIPDVILDKILSCLDLDDVSIVVVLCKYTSSIKKQIYESVRHAEIHNKFVIKQLIENCPKIKHLTIRPDDIDEEEYNLINRLNLETLIHDSYCGKDVVLKFKNLKNLEIRNLSYFDIEECTALESITVDSITKTGCAAIANLKLRIKNDMDFNDLPNGPINELCISYIWTKDIVKFPLDTLRITGKRATKYLSYIEQMNLKHLSIGYRNTYEGYNTVLHSNLNMPTLRTLELESVKLKLSMLKNLVNLTDLLLDNCEFGCGEFKSITELPITKLTLCKHAIVLSNLSELRLKYLSLCECNDTTGNLGELPRTLTYLEVTDSDITIGDMSRLDKLNTLMICDIESGNPIAVTDEELASISKLPITVLNLSGCILNDDSMDFIADMQVNDLNVESNNITIMGIRKLRRLPLRQLKASNIPLLHMTLF